MLSLSTLRNRPGSLKDLLKVVSHTHLDESLASKALAHELSATETMCTTEST